MNSHDDSLWADSTTIPNHDMSLRGRGFWWQHYLLADRGDDTGPDPDDRSWPERHAIYCAVELLIRLGDMRSLIINVSEGGSVLRLVDSETRTDGLIGRLDAAHAMPHTFRWTEIEAIAAALVKQSDLPQYPNLTLLLLAPFAAVTEDEDQEGIQNQLAGELDQLGLLTPAEVEVASSTPLIQPHPRAAPGQHARWVKNESVGWQLEGQAEVAGLPLPFAHSLRIAGNADFPAEAFKNALRSCGIDDL